MLGTSISNSLLILMSSFSICALLVLVLIRKNEHSSIMLMILVAPFTFLDWIASKIFSTAGHNGFPVRDSFSWTNQLIKTSVSKKIKLNSAIIGFPQAADNLDATFSFLQAAFKFSRQRLNNVGLFSDSSPAKEWLKRDYGFLERWAHCSSLLSNERYHNLQQKSIKIVTGFM